jgi:hypothetical protein
MCVKLCHILWSKHLVGLSLRRPRFHPRPIHVRFVVDKVALAQVFLQVIRFSPVSFIAPLLCSDISFICDYCYIIAVECVIK